MKQKTTVALFTYGGGMRGLIAAHFMNKLEETTGLRMADMIDIFSGPSTGAILNAAMTVPHPEHPGQPKYKAKHLITFYEREGINIFPQDSFREFRGIVHDFNNRTLKLRDLNSLFRHGHYDPSYLQRALKALYGEAKLSDALKTLIIPTYNIDGEQIQIAGESGDAAVHDRNVIDQGGHAVWLKHIKTKTPAGIENETPDVLLRDAVLASCAAPTYFPCHHFRAKFPESRRSDRAGPPRKWYEREIAAIDGVIFDNPCISYLGAIRRHVPQNHRLIMLILGTGYTNKSIKKEDWNRYGALGIVDPVNDLPLINIFFNASESALMDSFAEEMGGNLYIFNKSMIGREEGMPSPQIDDASPEQLKALKNFYEAILEENKKPFEDLCHILVNNRDQRHEEKKQNETIATRVKHFISLMKGNAPIYPDSKE